MKLNTKALRYLVDDDWRVLEAVEHGSRNHEIVPTPMIGEKSRVSGYHRSISALAKVDLIAKVKNAKYDGYRLTYGGLDYLALHKYQRSSTIYSVGNQIGVGKESDLYAVAAENGTQMVLKIHRLGRISFRTVKANRDYLRGRAAGSWMHLSGLAAKKEYAFLEALWREGFPVPEPMSHTRHTLVMALINSFPLRQIESVPDPASLYADLMELIVRFAKVGLIHGDFNEFNILIKEERKTEGGPITLVPIVIDFPQMLSITHVNAQSYFDRDVNCIKTFFERRFHFTADDKGPFFADAIQGSDKTRRLDIEVEATGFSRKQAKDLDRYIDEMGRQTEQQEPVDNDDCNEDSESDQARDESEDESSHESDMHDEIDETSSALDDQNTQSLSRVEVSHRSDKLAAITAPANNVKKAAGWAI